MASITKSNEGNQPADEQIDEGPGGDVRAPVKGSGGSATSYAAPARKEAPRSGFFTIHKPGQGYWTRMGTALGAGLLGFLTAYNVYEHVQPLFDVSKGTAGIIAGLFLAAFATGIWRLTNKPTNVDFLIATDTEMKKVNWTSRKELIGSTKVVIVFMFLIALFLFLIDIVFSYFFYVITVLRNSPFGGGGTIGGG